MFPFNLEHKCFKVLFKKCLHVVSLTVTEFLTNTNRPELQWYFFSMYVILHSYSYEQNTGVC